MAKFSPSDSKKAFRGSNGNGLSRVEAKSSGDATEDGIRNYCAAPINDTCT